MSDPAQKALETISRISERPVDELEPGMDLMVDLGIDSPKALELLIEIEESTGVVISDEDAADLDTVGDIVAYVEGAAVSSPK
ncbi:MAG: acyl carrier protein [Acidobacteriota bacterium]|nr:acyl carrier protein [Acidobacteriota bacterium]